MLFAQIFHSICFLPVANIVLRLRFNDLQVHCILLPKKKIQKYSVDLTIYFENLVGNTSNKSDEFRHQMHSGDLLAYLSLICLSNGNGMVRYS